jgi:small subunit ribosomal protein S6
MTLAEPTYDLVMLLDPQADESVRAKLLDDARAAIEAQGELLRHDHWGERALTYPIARKTAADYHLLQFHAGTPELLANLNRSLRIADDILRFRLVKLRPGVPDAPQMQSAVASARPIDSAPAPEREAEQPDGQEPEVAAEQVDQAEVQHAGEPPADAAEPTADAAEPTPEPELQTATDEPS